MRQRQNKNMNKRIFSLIMGFILLCWSCFCFAAPILDSLVDRTNIHLGETFQFIITLTNPEGNTVPNLNFWPLTKNFRILNKQQGVSEESINGQDTSVMSWNVTLLPIRTGQVVIPSMRIANLATQPLSLNIQPAEPFKSTSLPRAFAIAEISSSHFYQEAPFFYFLKIYFQANLSHAHISIPSGTGFQITDLNNDTQYLTRINQVPYEVYQKTYVITPLKNGVLQINPAVIKGEISTQQNLYGLGFLDNSPLKPIKLKTSPFKIHIEAIPAAIDGTHQLPAENLTIYDEWSKSLDKVQAGEPIIRTITVEAKGLKAEQLPPLLLPKIPDINSYVGAPALDTELKNGKLIATQTTKVTYVPMQSGIFQIPAMKINWWNTANNSAQLAQIPSTQMSVPRLLIPHHTSSLMPTVSAIPAHNSQMLSNPKVSIWVKNFFFWRTNSFSPDPWMWACLSLAGLWLITAIVIVWRSFQKRSYKQFVAPRDDKQQPATAAGQCSSQKGLEKACLENNSRAAHEEFYQWLTLTHPTLSRLTLHGIAEKCSDAPFASAIKQLDMHLYANLETSWDGHDFWVKFQKIGQNSFETCKSVKNQSILPNFYPA